MTAIFQKATKARSSLRMALIGPSGSGKTYTALNIAQHLGERVAVIDTERGSASKYSDIFDFEVVELESFEPGTYVEAIRAAESAGFDVLVIDSLSHAWMGKGGALDQVDKAAKRSQGGNSFGAWRDVTPQHNALVDAILGARLHILTTMRAKTEYVQEKDKSGRTQIRKVGLAPVQRDGLEYEFDVVAELTQDNDLIIGKTRCASLHGAIFEKAGEDVAAKLKGWLDGSAPAPEFASEETVRAYMDLLDEGEDLGITRRELPSTATEREAAKYLTGLQGAIKRKKEAQAAERKEAAPEAEPPKAEPRTLISEVQRKRKEAAEQPVDEGPFADDTSMDDPAPELDMSRAARLERGEIAENDAAPAPTPSRGQSANMRRFYAVAKSAGLAAGDGARPERMKAINAWLREMSLPEVESMSDIDDVRLVPLASDVESGKVKW